MRFGDFELDRGAYELRRSGRAVPLERIPLELLFLLAEQPGQLVTREEILQQIWGKDVFVDADSSINTAIRKIRRALKDNPEQPRLLHTIAGKGYRFTPPVIEQDLVPPPAPAPASSPVAGKPVLPSPPKPRRLPLLWLPLMAVAVGASVLSWRLWEGHHPASSGKVILVVLPFEDMSGEPQEEYFADGMTEEMITQIGNLDPQRLGVIARTSAMQYKGARKGTAEISRELGAAYLLEGSVRRGGGRVRVTAQLIQSSDQTHLWSESYDRELGDVLKVQSEIARAVAGKIELVLSPQAEARLAETRQVNPEAYDAYLQGIQGWNLRTKEGLERGIANFSRAVAFDPNYAVAYAGLARCYNLAPLFDIGQPAELLPKAEAAAQRALSLDNTLAEAHTALGFAKAHFDFDWPAAEREFQAGIDLSPNSADAHFFYSNSYLSPLGRHDAAIAEMKKALELDRVSPATQSFFGKTYVWARRYDEALVQFLSTAQTYPGFAINHERLAHAYARSGKYEEAIAEDAKARSYSGEDPETVIAHERALRQALASKGARGYWRKLLEFAQEERNPPEAYTTPLGRAIMHAEMGENGQALDWLEKGYRERDVHMTELAMTPEFDSLRQEPRFTRLLRQAGLPLR